MQDLRIYDQWVSWAKARYNTPEKLKNLPYLIKFNESLKKISVKHDIYFLFCDVIKAKFLSNTLLYRGGSPNYRLFKISPGGEYILNNPRYHLWKNCDIDSNILNLWNSFPNNRYEQSKKTIELPKSYDLFCLQLTGKIFDSTNLPPGKMDLPSDDPRWNSKYLDRIMPRDEWATRDAIKYATENKRYTIFKSHPVTSQPNVNCWKDFQKEGIINEYTIFVDRDGCNIDYLVDNADLVYSADSAVSLNAMLKGKRVATYYNTDLSEVIPQIFDSGELKTVRPVPEEDVKRFLTWYYYKLSFDIESANYEEKIENFVMNFKKGQRAKELFSCV